MYIPETSTQKGMFKGKSPPNKHRIKPFARGIFFCWTMMIKPYTYNINGGNNSKTYTKEHPNILVAVVWFSQI